MLFFSLCLFCIVSFTVCLAVIFILFRRCRVWCAHARTHTCKLMHVHVHVSWCWCMNACAHLRAHNIFLSIDVHSKMSEHDAFMEMVFVRWHLKIFTFSQTTAAAAIQTCVFIWFSMDGHEGPKEIKMRHFYLSLSWLGWQIKCAKHLDWMRLGCAVCCASVKVNRQQQNGLTSMASVSAAANIRRFFFEKQQQQQHYHDTIG